MPPAKEGNVGAATQANGGGHIVGSKSTMSGMARALALLVKRPVIDQTGLTGYYDFDVRWNGLDAPDGQLHYTEFGSAEFVGLLVSTLQSQFGLRLVSTTGPVEYWVVDHVEPPTEN